MRDLRTKHQLSAAYRIAHDQLACKEPITVIALGFDVTALDIDALLCNVMSLPVFVPKARTVKVDCQFSKGSSVIGIQCVGGSVVGRYSLFFFDVTYQDIVLPNSF